MLTGPQKWVPASNQTRSSIRFLLHTTRRKVKVERRDVLKKYSLAAGERAQARNAVAISTRVRWWWVNRRRRSRMKEVVNADWGVD